MLEFDALWDTGATASVVSQEVAAKLELLPEGTAEVFHAQGSKHAPKYFVNLGLPNRVQVVGVEVLEGILKGCDVLIGMDIINMGDFALTNRDGITMLSFQMPSIRHIDFVKILEETERKVD
ncbi:MAG: retroviral-like aspartic protease family protein [Chloroflexi bacterium]|nr:retroviral-like aspartic protease family protein [Chloroflexota bacterium]